MLRFVDYAVKIFTFLMHSLLAMKQLENAKTQYLYTFFIRNHFISNLVLDSLKFKETFRTTKKELRNFRQIAYYLRILFDIGKTVCYIHFQSILSQQFSSLNKETFKDL